MDGEAWFKAVDVSLCVFGLNEFKLGRPVYELGGHRRFEADQPGWRHGVSRSPDKVRQMSTHREEVLDARDVLVDLVKNAHVEFARDFSAELAELVEVHSLRVVLK